MYDMLDSIKCGGEKKNKSIKNDKKNQGGEMTAI